MDWHKLWDNIGDWFASAGVDILKAVLALVFGIIAVKVLLAILNRALTRSKLEKVAARFIIAVTKFILYLMVAYVMASMIGIPLTGFVAITTAAGLAISLALQGSVSNLASGVILISTKPFKENDFVEIAGESGSVKEIKMLYTVINTTDNKMVTIPNKNVVENTIVNYSANDTRKVIWSFDVAYSSDVEKVKAIINSVIINHEKVLLEPTPFIALKSLNESGINFMVSCWCNTADYWTVYYDILDSVFNEFKRENISIPYNQLEVRIRDDKEVLPFRNDILPKKVEQPKVEPKTQKQTNNTKFSISKKHKNYKNKKNNNQKEEK